MVSALIAIAISLMIGGAAWYITARLPGDYQVSQREFLIGAAISVVALLLAGPLIEKLILDNKSRYYEYWNGIEVAAVEEPVPCERDGDCSYTYNCDPYIVMVTYTTTDSDGNTTTHTRPETRYHDCPYVRTEYTYRVETTLGTYGMGGHFIKDRAAWRAGEAVPGDLPIGPPAEWKAARGRLDSGKPGGVTKLHAYKNFLLASDQTILDQYSQDIERYQKAGLLPDHTSKYRDPIYGYYLADKFQGVSLKLTPVENQTWNESLQRLNGYLGKQLQGDVHLAAVDAGKVGQADTYSQALFAYWKSDAFGKYALPKNAIAIVVGVRGGTIEWARATGGLPVGNEGLFTDVRNNLAGAKFATDTVVGTDKERGLLWQTLYGQNKYHRPCMECVQEGVDGYEYLKSEIYVSGWQRFWIIFIATILSAGMWAGFLAADDRLRRYY